MGNFCTSSSATATAEPSDFDAIQKQKSTKRASGTEEHKQQADQQAHAEVKQAEPKKLDPADFIVSKRENEVILREPGAIQGQQFIIEECKNCDIYLLDYSATVSIDECFNCRIFVGPCESSVFIRTTKSCKIVVACQQLRIRDCHDLDLLLYVSASQPVIENSDTIRIGCFNYSYFGLARQFTAAGLNPWNGEWSNVHDFHASTGKHWEFLPKTTTASDLLKPLADVGSATDATQDTIVPTTWGSRPTQHKDRVIVIIYPQYHDHGYTLLDALKDDITAEQIHVIRTRVIKCNKERATAIFGKKNDALVKQAATGSVIAIEFCGADVASRVRSVVSSSGWQDQMHVDTDAAMINHVFEPIAV